MILIILFVLVIFFKLYQYKYEAFEGNCIKHVENNLTFSLTKNKLQQLFDNYGDDDSKMKEAISYYMIQDLSNNVDFDNHFLDVSNVAIDPVNDGDLKLYSPSNCKLDYL
jgi:hypothetical protein